MRRLIPSAGIVMAVFLASLACGAAPTAPADPPAWTTAADRKPPMTAEETKAFIRRLHEFVRDHHLKTAENSPQRGMLYEYFNVPHAGKVDQWIQGEALDTMHDGSWYAAAMVNAFRATGDETYRTFLMEYQVPFYCKMLNHSDTLFSAKENDADPKAFTFNKEHMLQEGEKGFVPYWWDDGASVSLERVRTKNPLAPFMCRDLLAGKPNPDFRLAGYSFGSSNHLAQDLGVMVEQCWLLLRQSPDEPSKKLTAELADAAANLHACRTRHFGDIPMSLAPAALVASDAKMMKRVPDPAAETNFKPQNHYYRALYDFKPGQKMPFPGFADDDEYLYYFGTCRAGGKLPDPLAFRMIYDAYTEPLLYRTYCDDAPVPPGINKFDLHPYNAIDGKPTDYRSDRKGPFNKPRPIGSRMGPQNMVVNGWALQALRAHPGLWDNAVNEAAGKNVTVVHVDDMAPQGGAKSFDLYSVAFAGFKPFDALGISTDRSTLHVSGTISAAAVSLEIFSRADGQGTHALVTMSQDKSFKMMNDKGEELIGTVQIDPQEKNGFKFSISLPYSFVKGQKLWANGVERGIYSIGASGNKTVNFMIAASEATVIAQLTRQLAGGLRTWEAIFDQYGYIPTGINAGAGWDNFSDTGGYAHLISAASEWLMYLEKKSDWELQQVPPVLNTTPH